MAASVKGVTAAENQPRISVPAAREGVRLGGPFSLQDNQLFALQSGETVVPRSKYSDVEEGIKQRLRRDADGDLSDPVEQRVVLELTESAGRIFRSADDETEVLGT